MEGKKTDCGFVFMRKIFQRYLIVVHRSLAISVNSSDSSYVPHKVAIEGGDSVDRMTVLANVSEINS